MTPESCSSVPKSSRGPLDWPCKDAGLFMIYLGRVLFVRLDPRLTPEAFERYLIELERAIDLRSAGHLVGVVYDVPEMGPMDALRRRRVADVLSLRQRMLSSTTVAMALASPSKAVRGVLEAIHWMVPPVYAHTAVDTVWEALQFLRRFLPDVDPDGYEVEYRRRLACHGIFTTTVRPPPPSRSEPPPSVGPPPTRRSVAPRSVGSPPSVHPEPGGFGIFHEPLRIAQ
jgi:hypothetical protein